MPAKKGPTPLSSVLQSLVPDQSKRPTTAASAIRVAIRENFEDIAAARDRGVSWQQIVTALTDTGLRGEDGGQITVNVLRSLFHAERYSQGQRRKRRTKKPVAQPRNRASAAETIPPPQPPVTPDPDDELPRRGAFRAIRSKPRT